MCIICGVYCFRKKKLKDDPDYKMPIPMMASRSGSRSTLNKHPLSSDNSEMDDNSIKRPKRYDGSYDTHEPLKNKPDVQFEPKKMDLDEDDITSSEGNSSIDRKANDIEYRSGDPNQQRQMGRRSQRLGSDYKPIDEEENSINYPPPPNDSPSPYSPSFSPTFSGLDRDSFENQQPSPTPKTPPGGIRVMPSTQQQQPQRQAPSAPFNARPYISTGSVSPPLTQNVGLPRMDSKSTEV
jgi:hypothetical protein